MMAQCDNAFNDSLLHSEYAFLHERADECLIGTICGYS